MKIAKKIFANFLKKSSILKAKKIDAPSAEKILDEFPPELKGKVFRAEATEAPDQMLLAAKKIFGIEYLMPWQRLVIGNILDGAKDLESGAVKNFLSQNPQKGYEDVFCLGKQIVLLPTGAGKSLCFLVPAAMLPGPTLIFYPLLALMADQARRIENAGLECVVFRGGQSEAEREENFFRIKNGAKIILANPEVLQNESLVKRLRECRISHIAIDEAHCVSEWGDTFRPAYLTLGKIISDLDVELVTAFTATASPQILDRISQVLFGGAVHIVRGESDRPNIHYFVEFAWNKKKAACRLAATEEKPMIIFCGTRAKSEDMARELSECFGEEKVRFYHAGLSREEKTATEKWFFPKDDAILCCTCAFGMGVDKANVRTVIHLEASPTAESYIQEAGRGGRDRRDAKAILLWSFEDSTRLEQFPHESREYVIKKYAEAKTCRRQILLSALGGEEAICSGCDICDAARSGKKYSQNVWSAKDAKKAFSFIQKNDKFYSKNSAADFLKDEFNLEERKIFGKNVWTAQDAQTILEQLLQCGAAYDAGRFWKRHLGASKTLTPQPWRKPRRLPIPRFLRGPHSRRLRGVFSSWAAFFYTVPQKKQSSNRE